MKRALLCALLIFLCSFAFAPLQAQIDPSSTPPYIDATDLTKVLRGKK